MFCHIFQKCSPSSSQASHHSLPRRLESSFVPLLVLSPLKSLRRISEGSPLRPSPYRQAGTSPCRGRPDEGAVECGLSPRLCASARLTLSPRRCAARSPPPYRGSSGTCGALSAALRAASLRRDAAAKPGRSASPPFRPSHHAASRRGPLPLTGGVRAPVVPSAPPCGRRV